MARIHTGPRGGRYRLYRGRKIYLSSKRMRILRRGVMRMRNVPVIPAEQMSDTLPLREFLNEYVPYLYVLPSKYTVVLDGYIISQGSTKESYSLNKDFSFSPFEGRARTDVSPDELLEMFNKKFTFGKNVSLDPLDILMFRYVNIFHREKWLKLGVSSRNLQDTLKELLTEVPDQPVSTNPNIIHFFIFMNEMPAFIKLMTSPTWEADVKNIFNEAHWNETNALDVRALSIGASSKTLEVPLSDIVKDDKTKCIFLPLISKDTSNCPKNSYDQQIKILVDSIGKIRKLFEALQKNTFIGNLGYRFLLNYWMYRVFKLNTIQNRFPINRRQQIESLMSFASKDRFDSSILNLTTAEFVPQETTGLYKGAFYPNCVEHSVFQLLQVLSYDFERKQYNPDLLSSVSEPLRGYLLALNTDSTEDNREWNNIVCALPGVAYNSGQYNIKSNVENVLVLLNTLTSTSDNTLEEWVNGISRENPHIQNLDSTEDSIMINGKYEFQVDYGHSTFRILQSDDEYTTVETNIASTMSPDALYCFTVFDFLPTVETSLYVSAVLQRPDFKLIYVKGLVDLKTNDNVLRALKTSEDIFVMKKYRSVQDIIKYINVPTPQGLIDPDIKEFTFLSLTDQPLRTGILPKGLQTLELAYTFNQPIEAGVLPDGLKELTFGFGFNQKLEAGVLPDGLQTLFFEGVFNQKLEAGVLPEGLKELTFGNGFNQPIEAGVLPEGLKKLNIGYGFDKPIEAGVLPEGLQELTLGYSYRKPLKEVLPKSLKILRIRKANYRPEDLPLGPQIEPTTP